MSNKKAVSQMIAVALLVMLATAMFLVFIHFYNIIVREQKQSTQIQLAKQKCPYEFNFVISACYNTSTDGNITLRLIINNQRTTILSKSYINLVTVKNESVRIPMTLPFIDISATAPLVTKIDITPNGIPQKIKLEPVLFVKESNTEVVCTDFPYLDVASC